MGLFKNKPLMITIVVVIILIILMAGTVSSNTISEKTTLAGSAFVPLQRFFYRISASAEAFFTGSTDELQQENRELREENAQFKMQLSEYDELVAENERLTAALDYKQNNTNQELRIARITGKEPGNWFSVFTIDLGSKDGITENMPVITPDGLVGYVEEVGLNWSKVMGLVDSRCRVSAIMERTRDIGIVGGSISADNLSANLTMDFLPLDSDIVEGDIVVTSGLDGIFPKGMMIGEVVQTDNNANGIKVSIRPHVDFRRLEEVMVVIETEDSANVVNEDIADENAVVQAISTTGQNSESADGDQE